MAEVSPSRYDPDVYLTSTGNINLFNNGTSPVTGETIYGVNNNGQTDSRIGVFGNAVIGNLTAGNVDAQNLTLGGQSLDSSIQELQSAASQSANLNGSVNSLSVQDLSLQSSVNSLSGNLAQIQTEIATQEAQIQNLKNLAIGAFTASSSSQLDRSLVQIMPQSQVP
jgi:hypothetical protein